MAVQRQLGDVAFDGVADLVCFHIKTMSRYQSDLMAAPAKRLIRRFESYPRLQSRGQVALTVMSFQGKLEYPLGKQQYKHNVTGGSDLLVFSKLDCDVYGDERLHPQFGLENLYYD